MPVQAEPIAVRSIPQILDAVAWVRETGNAIRLLGFVVNMVAHKDPSSEAVVAEIHRLFPGGLIFQTAIRRDPIFLKASTAGVPLGLLSRRAPPAAQYFGRLANEIESRLQLEHADDGPISLLD